MCLLISFRCLVNRKVNEWVCKNFPRASIGIFATRSILHSPTPPKKITSPISPSSHTPMFPRVLSSAFKRAQGSHTKPGKDDDDSFVACPPRLCPHSSEMKGGNNYLHVWCLKSFDIYLVEQVWLTAALEAGLSFAPITVHVKMAETWELPISSTKLYVWSRQFSLAPNAVLHVQANLFWNNWQHECFMCYLWTASQDSL